MTNVELLKEKIASSGLKVSYIASQCGLSRSGLWKKINNITPFNQYEIEKICNVLDINIPQEKEQIFFTSSVD